MKHQKTIEQNVIKFIQRNKLLFDVKKILIALSGGADSVFALHFFYKFKNKFGIEISAAHINHNLRGKESDKDEKFCKTLCENFNVDFHPVKIEVKNFAKTKKLSTEEAARILRYKKLNEIAKQTKSDVIVTAHNINDNTETVLLNIVSGSGINGISGIPVKRENIIRPFLCIGKEDIKNYLQSSGLKYREDSSNKNTDFRRNYFRKKIIPKIKKDINPSLDKVVLTSSEVITKQKEALSFFVTGAVKEIVKKNKTKVIIKTSELKKYPEAVYGEIFKYIFQQIIYSEYSFDDFLKLNELLNSQTGTEISITKKIIAVKERGKIIIKEKPKKTFEKISIKPGESVKLGRNKKLKIEQLESVPGKIKKQNNCEIISADKIKNKLTIRTWQPGDKIQPLGMKGTKKISDILTDMKVPSYKRKEQFVLLNKNEIIWLIGLKLNDKYKITKQTKSAVKICLT